MHELQDHQLLPLLRSGSQEAYEILFKRYYKLLCLQAALFLMDEAEAEDLVIELFIDIWDKKIYRKIEHSFKSYIYQAVRNRCINVSRKQKLIQQKKEKYNEYREKEIELTRIEQRELAAHINDTLLEFPAQRLRAFKLIYMEEKRYQEVADEMGLSINTVKTHLKLALKVLRNKLEKFR
jgi:RNA polymerase sigma-70 factor (ECF subfamily)